MPPAFRGWRVKEEGGGGLTTSDTGSLSQPAHGSCGVLVDRYASGPDCVDMPLDRGPLHAAQHSLCPVNSQE